VRRSWWTFGLALGLALSLAGCKTLFPKPVYVPPTAPAPAPPPPQVVRPLFYVAVNRLNLRACPGMDCPKIGLLNRNEEVEKVGQAEDWTQIRVIRDGTIGWVSSRYLSATPVAVPPPEAAPAPGAPIPPEVVTPPPLPKPIPEKPPAVEKPKPPRPGEAPASGIKRKPEEKAPAKPAEVPPPPRQPAPAPVKPVKPEKPAKPEKPVKREKPAPAPPAEKPAPPAEKPTPPAEPAPEKPSSIRIM
jgi:hypothetical protein